MQLHCVGCVIQGEQAAVDQPLIAPVFQVIGIGVLIPLLDPLPGYGGQSIQAQPIGQLLSFRFQVLPAQFKGGGNAFVGGGHVGLGLG